MLGGKDLYCSLQYPESPGFRGRVGQGRMWNEQEPQGKESCIYDKSAIAKRLHADIKLDLIIIMQSVIANI